MDDPKVTPPSLPDNPASTPTTATKEIAQPFVEMGAQFLSWLGVGGNGLYQLFVLPERSDEGARPLIGMYESPWLAATALAAFEGRAHCFVSLNPLKPELRARARDNLLPAMSTAQLPPGVSRNTVPVPATNDDILEIPHVLIDIDPVRPQGFTDYCSSDQESSLALSLRQRIEVEIEAAVGAQPVRIGSGNGGALIYKLEHAIPTSDWPRIKRFLEALAVKFDTDEVHVDPGVFNPGRLTRVPGTVNVKLEAVGRPRRRALVEAWGVSPLRLDAMEDWLGLSPWKSNGGRTSARKDPSGTGPWPSDQEYSVLLTIWNQATIDHRRQDLALALAGAARKAGHPEGHVIAVVEQLAQDAGDAEVKKRLDAVKATFAKPMDDVTGWPALQVFGVERNDLPSLVVGDSASGNTSGREAMAARLVELAEEQLKLFHDEARAPYGRLKAENGRRELMRLGGKTFKSWLSAQMYEAEERVPSADAITAATGVLEAKALRGEQIQLWNRVARGTDGAIWIDMADRRGRAIRVSADGWVVVDDPPPLFRRYNHQQELPEPVKDGNPWKLLDLVKIPSWDEQILFVISTVVAFVPDIPQPILMILGQQGSAKTTAAKMRRRLINPSATPTTIVRRDIGELVQALSHNYAPLFDNVSALSESQTDLLCQAATGGGFSKRELYSDEDDVIYVFKRQITLTAITMPTMKGDLPDRSLMVRMERIAPHERREEQEIWEQFDRLRPEILGGLLNALVGAIRIRPTLVLPTLTRMADATRWGAAAAQTLGISPEDFLRAMWSNSIQQSIEFADTDSLASAIRQFALRVPQWTGTPTSLLAELNKLPGIATNAQGWPKSAANLGIKLKPLIPVLADLGVRVTHGRQTGGNRDKYWCIELVHP